MYINESNIETDENYYQEKESDKYMKNEELEYEEFFVLRQ